MMLVSKNPTVRVRRPSTTTTAANATTTAGGPTTTAEATTTTVARKGGTITEAVEQEFSSLNNNTGSDNSTANAYILGQVQPSPFFFNQKGDVICSGRGWTIRPM